MISSERPLAAALIAALPLVGCEADRPTPSGNFQRPSGLAYLERADRRADLFIADSEAQGIRILQFAKRTNGEGVEEDQEAFVPAPAVFFPLVVPARGFPTELALSDGAAGKTQWLYALAPAAGLLHVLETREAPFEPSSREPSNIALGSIDLAEVVSLPAIPVGLAVLPLGRANQDVVLVAFDALEQGSGILAAIVVERQGTTFTVSPGVETATIAGAPRDLLVRDGFVLATSALSSSISMVTTSSIGARVLTGSRVLDAGGPTSSLIDAGPGGVLAVRIDRDALVWLERVASGFARSARRFSSPFTPERDRDDPTTLGLLDVRSSPIVEGARGRLEALLDTSTDPPSSLVTEGDRGPDGLADVIAVSHVDGRASFLLGSPPRLAMTASSSIERLIRIDSPGLQIEECSRVDPAACGAETSAVPACAAGVVEADLPSPRTLRAVFRGALARSRSGRLMRAEERPNGVRFVLSDGDRSFEDRMIVLGDSVLLQLEAPFSCGGDPVDLTDTATVTSLASDSIELSLAATSSISRVSPCNASDGLAVTSYEVFPAKGEFVLAEVQGSLVSRVLSRTSTATDAIGRFVAPLQRHLRLTIASAVPFVCTLETAGGAPCLTDADCAVSGGSCALEGGAGCPGRCNAPCAPEQAGCLALERVRRCPGIEVSVSPAEVLTLDLSAGGAFSPAAPDEVVFSALRRSFIISYPGARGLAEGQVEPARGFVVRHFR